MTTSTELDRYQLLLEDGKETTGASGNKNSVDRAKAELEMAPLIWWKVKERVEQYFDPQPEKKFFESSEEGEADDPPEEGELWNASEEEEGLSLPEEEDDKAQLEGKSVDPEKEEEVVKKADEVLKKEDEFKGRGYAVLGHVPEHGTETRDNRSYNSGERMPVFLHTDTPWSAFLCGSQGSGKSHTLSCMIENCLLANQEILPQIGRNPYPLAGMVFHYDRSHDSKICEAAYLCTQVNTTVLVSPSSYGMLKDKYEKEAERLGATITVKRLYILPNHLNSERMKTLMAVGKDDNVPLYMQSILMILRVMAIESEGRGEFKYATFKTRLAATKFSGEQNGPMRLRMDLLESFMKPSTIWSDRILENMENDFLVGKKGELTIVDLTDPVIDADSACVLFDLCLSVFIEQTKTVQKIIALDEAHNYLSEDSAATKAFTDNLLRKIREQRHLGVRTVIATQEPSINTQLLDLCSFTMVHRCTSPAWFKVLKQHIAALFLDSPIFTDKSDGMDGIAEPSQGEKAVFQQIVRLNLGESLLFCPSAAIDVADQGIEKMEGGYVKFKTRQRVTADGGGNRTAAEKAV